MDESTKHGTAQAQSLTTTVVAVEEAGMAEEAAQHGRCGSCAYWAQQRSQNMGLCKRHAPSVFWTGKYDEDGRPCTYTAFARTPATEGCWEWNDRG